MPLRNSTCDAALTFSRCTESFTIGRIATFLLFFRGEMPNGVAVAAQADEVGDNTRCCRRAFLGTVEADRYSAGHSRQETRPLQDWATGVRTGISRGLPMPCNPLFQFHRGSS